MAISIEIPFQFYVDADGSPLDNGFIYIGTPGYDPQSSPVQLYVDSNLTIPIAQPIRTHNGFAWNAGRQVRLFAAGTDYSQVVKNKNGVLISSALFREVSDVAGGGGGGGGGGGSTTTVIAADGSFGNLGSESDGINLAGSIVNAPLKVGDINESTDVLSILHRHSSTLPVEVIAALSASDDETHAVVSNGNDLFTLYAVGWTGTEYNIFGSFTFKVASDGTINDDSAPGAFELALSQAGSTNPAAVLSGKSNGDLATPGQLTSINRINQQSGDYALVADDADKVVESIDEFGAQTFTIVNANFNVGQSVYFRQGDYAQLTIALDSGTLELPPQATTILDGQNAMAGAYKKAADTWSLFGNLYHLSALVGIVAVFPSAVAPPGWLACDGQAVSRTDYAELWVFAQASFNLVAQGSKQSGNFGDGNGATTFTLPDYRGQFLRGWDAGRGVDSGRGIGTDQADAVKSHEHYVLNDNYPDAENPSGSPVTNSNAAALYSSTGGEFSARIAGIATPADVGLTTMIAGGTETRPTNVAVGIYIKY